uniref:NADH-ubiquinone oxidoreductase chain 4 n=1 Tax=Paleosuchus palpebrosus TaxID=84099 RepID=A7DWR2_PALPA|nr:NADH dehydrogenase subunit 4 [Paleosuchus palpebrosus]AIN75510.1 NADH dehydrogenase subunit 4 [Paleosuchus palpebrosus]QOI74297.1 NADH dehydrogenase subunit 4 [Paleosuchus palpebrosus]CAM35794.1 NADH dehydrogenase subunit 4 [Paleosuchus palpebrosus]
MLKILLPTAMVGPTTLTPNKTIWLSPTTCATAVMIIPLLTLNPSDTLTNPSNQALGSDQYSSPLMMLSCWLLPLMLMASQNAMSTTLAPQIQMFISILATLQLTLLMAFMALDLMLFYIMFETTLLPTLVTISRWGARPERLNAGAYFLFYTITSSIPLMISILMIHNLIGTLSLPILQLTPMTNHPPWTNTLFWLSTLVAFLVKIPIYGLHLWLPKAHVEAPIAGSMVLAAVLLKLGGYGMLRVTNLLTAQVNTTYLPLLTLALWGALTTSLICLRQTDLKSLIAYSSVSHMALVTATILARDHLTPTGSMILMVAHGLTSSMLFCLANFNYERTHTRTLITTQGMQLTSPALTAWWFLACSMNMALPPTFNLTGELTVITSLFNWLDITVILTGLSAFMTAVYTLYMFSATQQWTLPTNATLLPPTQTREHLLMLLHLLPSAGLTTNPKLTSAQ